MTTPNATLDRLPATLLLSGGAGLLGALAAHLAAWGLAVALLSPPGTPFALGWQSGFKPALQAMIPGRQKLEALHQQQEAVIQQSRPAAATILDLAPWVAGLALGGLIFWLLWQGGEAAATDRHIRGRRLLKGARALQAFAQACAQEVKISGEGIKPHPALPPVSIDRETRHFLIFGGVGGGKTQTILPMMLAAHARGDRMIVFDNKGDFSAKLPASMDEKGRKIPPLIFSPWDKRSPGWAVALDVQTQAEARELAARLIPDTPGQSNPMWANAARQVLTASVAELQVTQPGNWSWPDLVRLLTRPQFEQAQAAKRYFPEAMKALGGEEGKENVTTIGIQTNLMSYLMPVFQLAQAWPNPGKVSIKQWLKNDRHAVRTIILPGNGQFETLARAFAGAIIGLASQLINSPMVGESKTRKIWFFLDEFPQLGKLESIFPLCEIGRSKGVRVVIGAQDINQIRHIHGAERTAALVSMVGTHVVARVMTGETAKFIAEDLIGEREIERLDTSHTAGAGRPVGIFSPGGTQTSAWRRIREPVILPAQLTSELGPTPRGVKVMWLAVGPDALVPELPFTSSPDLREACQLADWVHYPVEVPQAPAAEPASTELQAAHVQQADQQEKQQAAPAVSSLPGLREEAGRPLESSVQLQAPETQALPAASSASAVGTAAALKVDIDGDEVGEDEDADPGRLVDPLDMLLGLGGETTDTEVVDGPGEIIPILQPGALAQEAGNQAGDAVESLAKEALTDQLAHALPVLPAGLLEVGSLISEVADALEQVPAGPVEAVIQTPPTQQTKKRFRKKQQSLQHEEGIE